MNITLEILESSIKKSKEMIEKSDDPVLIKKLNFNITKLLWLKTSLLKREKEDN